MRPGAAWSVVIQLAGFCLLGASALAGRAVEQATSRWRPGWPRPDGLPGATLAGGAGRRRRRGHDDRLGAERRIVRRAGVVLASGESPRSRWSPGSPSCCGGSVGRPRSRRNPSRGSGSSPTAPATSCSSVTATGSSGTPARPSASTATRPRRLDGQVALRARPPGGPGRRRQDRPRRWQRAATWPVPVPGPVGRRHLASRRVHGVPLPRDGRPGPAADHRARRQRPDRAAQAGDVPDLPRRAHRAAEPGLRRGPGQGRDRPRRGRRAGPAARAGRGDLHGPGRLHRGQRLGRARRGRPAAGPGRPPPARGRAAARTRWPAGAATSSRCSSRAPRARRRSSTSPSASPGPSPPSRSMSPTARSP